MSHPEWLRGTPPTSPKGTEAHTVVIVLTPVDAGLPVNTDLEVKACLKPVLVSTTHYSGETTTPPVETTTFYQSCKFVEGMHDPLLLPSQLIVAQAGSDKEGLRPNSVTPWQSRPEVYGQSYILIQLSADGLPINISEIHFVTMDNVASVELHFKQSRAGSKKQIDALSRASLAKTNNRITFLPGTTAAVLELILTPLDDSYSAPLPMNIRLEIIACFGGSVSITAMPPTVPTTLFSGSSTPHSTSASTPACIMEDGMWPLCAINYNLYASCDGPIVEYF